MHTHTHRENGWLLFPRISTFAANRERIPMSTYPRALIFVGNNVFTSCFNKRVIVYTERSASSIQKLASVASKLVSHLTSYKFVVSSACSGHDIDRNENLYTRSFPAPQLVRGVIKYFTANGYKQETFASYAYGYAHLHRRTLWIKRATQSRR